MKAYAHLEIGDVFDVTALPLMDRSSHRWVTVEGPPLPYLPGLTSRHGDGTPAVMRVVCDGRRLHNWWGPSGLLVRVQGEDD